MDLSSTNVIDLSFVENILMERVYANIGNIILIIVLVFLLIIGKKLLQSTTSGSCPYCRSEFFLEKNHHDKLCTVCGKVFRLRNMKIYKAEDIVDELSYYITKAFACLTVMSGDILDIQKKYIENFALSQGLTRRQFEDMTKIYNKGIKNSLRWNFYKDVIDKLRLYIEDCCVENRMTEIENSENNMLSLLYDFAMIDGKVIDEEMKFFVYFKKIFNMKEERFNSVINGTYQESTNFNNYETYEDKKSNSYENRYSEHDESQQKSKNVEYNSKSQEYYKVLGCESTVSDDEVKKQYKKMMMQYHPDKYASSDLPEEIEKMLNDKMSELNEAYEYIKKERGIN